MRALPNEGWRFQRWQGRVVNPKSSLTTLDPKRTTTVVCFFERQAEEGKQ